MDWEQISSGSSLPDLKINLNPGFLWMHLFKGVCVVHAFSKVLLTSR